MDDPHACTSDDLVIHEPAGEVGFVDAHVEVDAAADCRIREGDRWRPGIELEAGEHDRPSDRPGRQSTPRAPIGGIEPAHEADLETHACRGGGSDGGLGLDHGQCQGLLAEDFAAGRGSLPDDVEMVGGRDSDDDPGHVGTPDKLVGVPEYGLDRELVGQPPSRPEVAVRDAHQVRLGHVADDGTGQDGAHPPCADQAERSTSRPRSAPSIACAVPVTADRSATR
jgi:hypothetical protein